VVCHTKQKRRKATLVFFVACLRRFFGVLFFTCSYASMSYLVDAKLNSRHYLNKSPILTSNHFFDLFISRLYLLILTMLQYHSNIKSLMSNRLLEFVDHIKTCVWNNVDKTTYLWWFFHRCSLFSNMIFIK